MFLDGSLESGDNHFIYSSLQLRSQFLGCGAALARKSNQTTHKEEGQITKDNWQSTVLKGDTTMPPKLGDIFVLLLVTCFGFLLVLLNE